MSKRQIPPIYDAESWRDEQKTGPSPERLRCEAAAQKKGEVGKKMREWLLFNEGRGFEYERLIAEWTDAQTYADRAFSELEAAIISKHLAGNV